MTEAAFDVAAIVAANRAAEARARAARPASGLVRLETTVTRRLTTSEEQRIRDAQRRGLRLFKSLSCSGDLLKEETDERGRRLKGWFLTMTYRPECDWQPEQISKLIRALRAWCARRETKLRFLWVAEQHKSGRIHYHAIVWLPRHLSLPCPDKQGWWPHGMTNRQPLRKQSVGYLIKYATKCHDIEKPWPKGCRLHGHGGLTGEQRARRAWWVLPRYIRDITEDFMRVRRAKGGGWFSPVIGEWWPSWKGPIESLSGQECAA